MGPTRKRDLMAGAVVVALFGFLMVRRVYSWFPPITVWTGLPLLVLAVAGAGWGRYVRAKIDDGEIGVGPTRLHPLAVARSLVAAKASSWVGALVFGWWIAVLGYLLGRRWQPVAVADTAGVVVAALSALALMVAGLWLQHCCKSPPEPPEHAEPL